MKDKLIEAIREDYIRDGDFIPESREFTDDDLKDHLYETIDIEYLEHEEERTVAQVGERFFRYYRSNAEGIDLSSLEEVEPYDEIVTRYRPK